MNKRSDKALMTLYNGLFEMLEETPFDKVTVRGICAYTKVNKMTFYKYHTDKYDVLSKAIRAKFNADFDAEFGSNRSLMKGAEFEESLTRGIRFVFLWCKKYAKVLRNLFTSANQIAYDVAKSILFKDYFAYISQSIDFSKCDVGPEYVSAFLFGGFVTAMEKYLRDLRTRADLEAVEQENIDACRFLAHALATTFDANVQA